MKETEIKKSVREGYAKVATQETSCCGPASSSCCGSTSIRETSKKVGYSEEDMNMVPEGANLGLGCGNPVALASLKEGETVLDLGSGAGFDCFIAANQVGKTGRIIGVDMTPEMVEKARENAEKGNYQNVEFRLGELENLPAADNSVDVIISNCVINLVPDKSKTFREAYRVIKPGGRLMVSDIVLTKPLPEEIRNSIQAYIGCVSGASQKDDYLKEIEKAGFKDVIVQGESSFSANDFTSDPVASAIVESLRLSPERAMELAGTIVSMKVSARKAE